MRTSPVLASIALVATLVAGCSSDDPSTSEADPEATVEDGSSTTTGGDSAGAGDASACPEGPGTMTISAISGEDAAAITDANASTYEGRIGIEETDVELADAVAVELAGGAALTFYLTDFPLDRETVAIETQDAANGKLLASVFATVYQSSDGPAVTPEPIEAGEVIPPSQGGEDIGTGARVFDVIVDNGEQMHNESVQPEGEVEILYLDDEKVCFSIDYTSYVFGTEDTTRDVAKHISGTFSADIVESMF